MMKKLLIPIFTIVLGLQFTNAQTADVSQYVMYFPFDNNLTDASATGVVLNPKTASVVDTYEAGQFGQAALFNEKPYLTTNSIFESGESYTMLMWVKFNTLVFAGAGTPKIIHQEDAGPTSTFLAGRPFQIATAANTVNTSFGETATNSSATPPVNTWVHLALVMDKTAETVTLYVNGVEDASNTIGNPIKVDNKTNNAQLSIGVQKNSDTAGLLDAYLDDFVITTEVLDATTINNVMTNGAANGGVLNVDEFTQANTNLKLYKTDINTLHVDSNVSFSNYQIIDTMGKTVRSGNLESESINVSSITNGLYFVKLTSTTENLIITKKVIL
ncbi:LamG-like jellyroll fold domain-containing protein [uncultured Winogradskyella sp.]|uniref:LamG-like jellyroll fold domain-containing protein n=1 Tax=uncultured Winogradskyella sp. TaxID=395353 RepID=UPI0030D8241C|tara:strand:+ start:97075 stop:98064 length:990 start_codon:yes stop_codon:yes gene_type:complete